MKPPRTTLRAYLTLLGATALLLALAGSLVGHETRPPALDLADAAQVLPNLEGPWVGTWEDTTYLVSGAVSCNIVVNGDAWTATGTIDLSSIGFGLGVMPGTATGSASGNSMTFTFEAGQVGFGGGTLDGGAGAGSGTVTAPMNFGEYTFTGTATPTQITGTFDFLSPTGGEGVVTLTPGVANEALSWSDVKGRWR